MKKQLLFLGLSILFLVSCGSEVAEVKKKAEYIYVEIEECSIPVPKMFQRDRFGNIEPYTHSYSDYTSHLKYKSILTRDRYVNGNDNIEKVSDLKDKLSEISKKLVEKNWHKNNFHIYEFYAEDLDSVQYFMVGDRTIIIANNIDDINYLLDYCKKTWKLNKGEKNASTAK